MEKLIRLYIDCSYAHGSIDRDDFVISIGKTKSNSVYHVVESAPKFYPDRVRWNLKVLKSDLITALRRDPDQGLVTLHWYPRDKKKSN